MKIRMTLLLFLFTCIVEMNGQIQVIVIDGETNVPIPYINIWVEGEDIGTNSDHQGIFDLNAISTANVLIFSGIGYESIRLKPMEIVDTIRMYATAIEIEEVLFVASREKVE